MRTFFTGERPPTEPRFDRMALAAAGAPIETILVVTDLSAGENIAVQRASQLAATHGAALKLVYMPARLRDPVVPPLAVVRAARQLEEALALPVTVSSVGAGRLEDLAAQARGADLVVVPHRRERSTAAFFRGQPVARLLRLCGSPVLVARAARAAHYARILVGVPFADTPDASESLVRIAARLDPHAELQVFHAISTLNEARLRSAEATEAAVRLYRERCLEQAQDRMLALTASFGAQRRRLFATLGRGDPGTQTVVQQQRSGADLVVVGKTGASAWEDFVSGSVSHSVLSWGSSDVLVVPQAHVEATAPVAMRRARRAAAQPTLATAAAEGGLS